MSHRRRMSVSKAAEFDKMLEGEDQKEESLHDLFGKGSDDQAGDDESDEEEEEEEVQVKEEGQVQAVKFDLADLDDSHQEFKRAPSGDIQVSASGGWKIKPEKLTKNSVTITMPLVAKSGDWISIPLGGGEDYKFQVQPNMRPGQLIEIQHTEEPEQEVIKVKVPSGAQPGDILRAKAKDGRNVKVAVPQGVQDGEIIRAVVPPLIQEEDLQLSPETSDEEKLLEYDHSKTHYQNFKHLGTKSMAGNAERKAKAAARRERNMNRIALKKSLKVASILQEELVIVEDGQKEGDTVWCKPNGDALRAFQYVVPEGAVPGDRIYVQPLKREYDMSSELNSERLEKMQAQRRERRRSSILLHAEIFEERTLDIKADRSLKSGEMMLKSMAGVAGHDLLASSSRASYGESELQKKERKREFIQRQNARDLAAIAQSERLQAAMPPAMKKMLEEQALAQQERKTDPSNEVKLQVFNAGGGSPARGAQPEERGGARVAEAPPRRKSIQQLTARTSSDSQSDGDIDWIPDSPRTGIGITPESRQKGIMLGSPRREGSKEVMRSPRRVSMEGDEVQNIGRHRPAPARRSSVTAINGRGPEQTLRVGVFGAQKPESPVRDGGRYDDDDVSLYPRSQEFDERPPLRRRSTRRTSDTLSSPNMPPGQTSPVTRGGGMSPVTAVTRGGVTTSPGLLVGGASAPLPPRRRSSVVSLEGGVDPYLGHGSKSNAGGVVRGGTQDTGASPHVGTTEAASASMAATATATATATAIPAAPRRASLSVLDVTVDAFLANMTTLVDPHKHKHEDRDGPQSAPGPPKPPRRGSMVEAGQATSPALSEGARRGSAAGNYLRV